MGQRVAGVWQMGEAKMMLRIDMQNPPDAALALPFRVSPASDTADPDD
jgi:hypothetical protein